MPTNASGTLSDSTGRESSISPVQVVLLILLGACFVSMGVIGFLFHREIQTLDDQMERLQASVEDLQLEVQAVSEISSLARSSARQAEEFARIAADGRAMAEASRDAYEERARLAQVEASSVQSENLELRDQLNQLRKQREEEFNRLQKALNRIADTRRTALGLVMNLGSDLIQFDFDDAALKGKNRELLSRIAGILLTSEGYKIQVYGHTDDVGTVEYNQVLSERRAETVRDYLIEAGVDPDIITTEGLGKSNPIVPGRTPQARSKNRRVEIAIIDTMISFQGLVDEAEDSQ